MEQERFMVIDNEKGVIIPLQSEKRISMDKLKELQTDEIKDTHLEEKVDKIYQLIKVFVKKSIVETVREYNLQLTHELNELQEQESKRWEKLEEADSKRWENMEQHFLELDRMIREKQGESKTKKHSKF